MSSKDGYLLSSLELSKQAASRLTNSVKTVQPSRAMTPPILMCSIISPTAIFAACFSSDTPVLCAFFCFLALLVVAFACASYLIMLFKKPDLLKSDAIVSREKVIEFAGKQKSQIVFKPFDLSTLALPYEQN